MKNATDKHNPRTLKNSLKTDSSASLLSKEISAAVEKSLSVGLSFALFIFPGENETHFFASYNLPGTTNALTPDDFDRFDGFVFNMFELSETLHSFGIRPQLSAHEVNALELSQIPEQRKCSAIFSYASTDPLIYYAQVRRIVRSLQTDNEKTVLSRIVSMPLCDISPIYVAEKYFRSHPSCFRFLYYTPESGIWLGASPELIIDYNRISGELISMSLAGTRVKTEATSEWDDKNRMEHDMVTDFIVDVLRRHCSHVDEPGTRSVSFGEIEHLCHMISARGAIRPSHLLPELCPTPALCGFPRAQAFDQIRDTEAHRRLCYGGFVGFTDPMRTRLFANLRSAMIDKDDSKSSLGGTFCYNLYAGGGLTRYSDPESEFIETSNKMHSLYQIIDSNQIF